LSDDHGLRTLVTDEIHPTDTPLVSVIVPVFNAERHLAACLSSLLAQTLVPIEIIAVDDGSTDSSPALLAAVSAEGRIRVLTMAGNGGVSAARNSGLEAACAPYVAFVDADDTVDSTMYERLHRAAERGGADIVYCGMRLVAADGALVGTEPPPLSPHHVHDPTEVRRLLHDAWDRRLLWYPSRGIYRRSLLDANDIRFDTGIRKGEDSLFNLEALSLAQRVTAIDEALYDYRKHEASATARPLASESANLERLGQVVTQFYRDHAFEQSAFDDFYRHVLRSDLPTAVVRLGGDESARREIGALLRTETVQQAFRTQRISQLRVPARVKLLLLLARRRHVSALVVLLRLTRRRPRLRAG